MYKFILPKRYFFRRKISFLAIAAVALCVLIVVVVMTVMNGLVNDFRGKNHNFVGDCVVSTDSLVGFAYYEEFIELLQKQDFVSAVSPVVRSYGIMTQQGSDWNMGVEVMGIDAGCHSEATGFGDTLYYHKTSAADAFKPTYNPSLSGCVIGIDMIGIRNSRGNYNHPDSAGIFEIIISCVPLTAKGAPAKAGTDFVNTLNFYFSDDSHSGLVKVDGRAVYIPLETAQQMLGMGGENPRASSIHIKFKNGVNLERGCEKVKQMWNGFVEAKQGQTYANLLENVNVESWIENRRGTIAPMEKEQTMLIFLFLMLGVITVFIIFVVFYMIVSHKSKDIGIFKSIGISPLSIIEVFQLFAAMIGVVGAAIGLSLGCVFLLYVNEIEALLFKYFKFQVWNRAVYAIGDIPNEIHWEVLVVIGLSAVAACLVGAFIPSVQAARRRPAEILQVNQL